ncbi:MAG: ABC transporter permease, partial [Cyanobacteria bacterium J069]
MNWWQKLKRNSLARYGALVLLLLYLVAIGAEFFAPYDPYVSQTDGSLLPPTQVFWRSPSGQFLGPHVYPTTQGAVDLETGDRQLAQDLSQPSPVRLFVKG